MKAKVYCNIADCARRKTLLSDTGDYSRFLCCNSECKLFDKALDVTESVIVNGWVARNATGKILFFKGKDAPRRPLYDNSPKQWHGSASPDNGIPIIPKSAFPNLTWEDDPIEVEIKIMPKK